MAYVSTSTGETVSRPRNLRQLLGCGLSADAPSAPKSPEWGAVLVPVGLLVVTFLAMTRRWPGEA